jgi:hypothetical protein
MDEELGGFFLADQIDDDGLAYAMDSLDAAAGRVSMSRRAGRSLWLVACPDNVWPWMRAHAIGYGFDFGSSGALSA